MMKYLLTTALLLSSYAIAEDPLCKDFVCLSQNSLEQYRQDHEQWWDIYNRTAALAKECKNEKEVETFLLLWSGQVDGEMASAFYEDNDVILDKHTSCFISALEHSQEEVRNDFFNKWCPFVLLDPKDKIEKHLAENPSDKIANHLLARLNSDECKS